mmetsp:Transcript_152265/g.265801  ORF Transcript_152265/g.265801 Transcript_152265/m.265801 type:complete len:203 (-) Transcript_152265:84-692(-)
MALDVFWKLIVHDEQGCANAVPPQVPEAAQAVHITLDTDVILHELTAPAEGEGAAHASDLAHGAGADSFFHGGGPRVVHPHRPIHQLHSVDQAGSYYRLPVVIAGSHGLLQQDVFPSHSRLDAPPDVQGRGEGDVHGIHVGVPQHLIVAAICPGTGNIVEAHEVLGLLQIPAADCCDLNAIGQLNGPHIKNGNVRGAEYPNS